MAGPKPERTPEEVASALLKADGLVTFAAKQLRLAPKTVYEYINKYPIVKQALEDARTGMGDAAESKLYRNVRSGDQRALEFYLKTIHKSRGYVERQELAGVEDRPIAVNINRIVSRPPVNVDGDVGEDSNV
jgi:hypothetical protein